MFPIRDASEPGLLSEAVEVERLFTPTRDASEAENAGDAVLFAVDGADCRRSLFFGRKIFCANSSALRLLRSTARVRIAGTAIVNRAILAFLNDLIERLGRFVWSHAGEPTRQ